MSESSSGRPEITPNPDQERLSTIIPLYLGDPPTGLHRRDCDRCGLRDGCSGPVFPANPSCKLLVVGDRPGDDEDLLDEPFRSADAEYFRKLLARAGLEADFTYAVRCAGQKEAEGEHYRECGHWLREELNAGRYRAIMTLGAAPTTSLLGLPKSAKLGPLAGRPFMLDFSDALVVPWYSAHHIYERGKSVTEETLECLENVKAWMEKRPTMVSRGQTR